MTSTYEEPCPHRRRMRTWGASGNGKEFQVRRQWPTRQIHPIHLYCESVITLSSSFLVCVQIRDPMGTVIWFCLLMRDRSPIWSFWLMCPLWGKRLWWDLFFWPNFITLGKTGHMHTLMHNWQKQIHFFLLLIRCDPWKISLADKDVILEKC